jgi:hypothetical protein
MSSLTQGGSDTPNAGKGFRAGAKSPLRGGRAGARAVGTESQSSNTPRTANPKTITKPKAVTFPQYGRGGTSRGRNK